MFVKKQLPSFPATYIQAGSFSSDKDKEGKASQIFIDGVAFNLADCELVYLLTDNGVIIDSVMGVKNENDAL
ncbi:hypothetical protein [Proteus faecis]|uniref:hypothetical protein n=1 Tax=Proteus faecis TaxID=2050967 RepID=UPI001F2E5597|nr:hypothetical protein [Proteus faecis]